MPAKKALLIRIAVLMAWFSAWHWSQALLSSYPPPECGIGDRLLDIVHPLNAQLAMHHEVQRYLLIVTSFFLDVETLFFCLYIPIKNNDWHVTAALGIGSLLRQICQFMNQVPPPDNYLPFFDPGFPSLVVTYGTTNDFFFSGHALATTIFVLAWRDHSRHWSTVTRNLSVIGIVLVASLELSQMVLRNGHYFMDIYGAVITALLLYRSSLVTRLAKFLAACSAGR